MPARAYRHLLLPWQMWPLKRAPCGFIPFIKIKPSYVHRSFKADTVANLLHWQRMRYAGKVYCQRPARKLMEVADG